MALILVAEDVPYSRDALARALREHGHEVVVAADGQEALDRFQRGQTDAAVIDVNLPRLSGIDVCNRIKALPGRHTPVILVSGKHDLGARLAALAVADDFLPKPYEVPELLARLETQLRTRRLLDESRARRAPTAAPQASSAPDPIPGLRTRAALLERLNEEWLRAVRFNEPLSLLLVGPDPRELDSQAVVLFTEAVQRVLRQIDVTARYQGADICALLPNTHVAGALVAASRLKRELAQITVASAALTASMGIAFYPGRDIAEQSDLIRMAERAIGRAREEGPGHICLYQHQGYLFQPE